MGDNPKKPDIGQTKTKEQLEAIRYEGEQKRLAEDAAAADARAHPLNPVFKGDSPLDATPMPTLPPVTASEKPLGSTAPASPDPSAPPATPQNSGGNYKAPVTKKPSEPPKAAPKADTKPVSLRDQLPKTPDSSSDEGGLIGGGTPPDSGAFSGPPVVAPPEPKAPTPQAPAASGTNVVKPAPINPYKAPEPGSPKQLQTQDVPANVVKPLPIQQQKIEPEQTVPIQLPTESGDRPPNYVLPRKKDPDASTIPEPGAPTPIRDGAEPNYVQPRKPGDSLPEPDTQTGLPDSDRPPGVSSPDAQRVFKIGTPEVIKGKTSVVDEEGVGDIPFGIAPPPPADPNTKLGPPKPPRDAEQVVIFRDAGVPYAPDDEEITALEQWSDFGAARVVEAGSFERNLIERPYRFTIIEPGTPRHVHVQFNPTEFHDSVQVEFARFEPPGGSYSHMHFNSTKNYIVEMDLYWTIRTRDEYKVVTYYRQCLWAWCYPKRGTASDNGASISLGLPKLTATWPGLFQMDCYLAGLEMDYLDFAQDGSPRRFVTSIKLEQCRDAFVSSNDIGGFDPDDPAKAPRDSWLISRARQLPSDRALKRQKP